MATSTIELPAATLPTQSSRSVLRPLALATPVILLLGGIEGWFGKTDSGDVYGSDAVQYLDCARAITAHHWHTALNPLWSQGYPALLALTHTLFPVTPMGDWLTTRLLNLLIFALCWLTFSFFLTELGQLNHLRPLSTTTLIAASAVFLTAQITLDQVSRVGPDQLLAAFFFLACALLLRLRRRPGYALAASLGLVLGLGFLTKAAFLILGCAILAIAIRKRVPHDHRSEAKVIVGRVTTGLPQTKSPSPQSRSILLAASVFAIIVLTYGAALSRATGHLTLGEAGSLNYAWHVNRLAKWVHWQGGTDPAEKAWPRPSIARFAHWQTDPPDFGAPTHPTRQLGSGPTILVFNSPSGTEATYPPYYDPAFFYQGYHHLFRWRYQLIALAKNTADLLEVLLKQPVTYALALIAIFAILDKTSFRRTLRQVWPAAACALLGIALYLPVHLEGRYLSAFLAVLATLILLALEAQPRKKSRTALLTLFFLAATAGLVHNQAPLWSRALHHWTPRTNVEWRTADAVLASGPPRGAQIGMISWTPNLHADWAYLSGLRITAEIASGPDEAAFWSASPARQAAILQQFHQSGAAAVLTQDPPRNQNSTWQQLPNAPLWIHRFQP